MPHPQSTIQKGSDKNRSEPHRAQADLSADPISQPVLTSTTTALAPVFEQGDRICSLSLKTDAQTRHIQCLLLNPLDTLMPAQQQRVNQGHQLLLSHCQQAAAKYREALKALSPEQIAAYGEISRYLQFAQQACSEQTTVFLPAIAPERQAPLSHPAPSLAPVSQLPVQPSPLPLKPLTQVVIRGNWQAVEGLQGGQVQVLVQDPQTQTACLGLVKGGVYVKSAQQADWRFTGLAGQTVSHLACNRSERIALTDQGLFYQQEGQDWQRISSSLLGTPIHYLLPQSQQNGFWLRSSQGLFSGSAQDWQKQPEAQNLSSAPTGLTDSPYGLLAIWGAETYLRQADQSWQSVNQLSFKKFSSSGPLLVASSLSQLYLTSNGYDWQASASLTGFGSISALGSSGQRVVMASELGVFRFADNQWQSLNTGLQNLKPGQLISFENAQLLLSVKAKDSQALAASGLRLYNPQSSAWQNANQGLLGLSIKALAEQGSTLLVATTSGEAVLRSLDGGQSWQASNLGLPQQGCQDLSLHPLRQHEVLSKCQNHLYYSQDLGSSWQAQSTDTGAIQAWVRHPQQPDWIYAISTEGKLWKSLDQGQSWQSLNSTLASSQANPIQYLSIDSQGTLITSLKSQPGRVYASQNEGLNWQMSTQGLAIEDEITQLWPHPAGSWYALSQGQIYYQTERQQPWQLLELPDTQEKAQDLTFDSISPDALYISTSKHLYLYQNQKWSLLPDQLPVKSPRLYRGSHRLWALMEGHGLYQLELGTTP